MNQLQLIYSVDSAVVVVILFAAMMLCNEVGFRIGRFVQEKTDSEIKSLTGSIQGSILGLLALLLGFTFSMSMQRYDNRSLALIAEANAIGTTTLRAQLLPEHHQANVAEMLEKYIDLRIGVSQVDMTRTNERRQYNQEISMLQNRLWSIAVDAAQEDPRPVTTGTFITALNEMIDSQGKRNALLHMHVPEIVLFLLFAVFVASGGMLGYSSGLGGRRVVAPTVIVSVMIAMIVFIIIDLDRPKRGLIQVDQGSLLELRKDEAL